MRLSFLVVLTFLLIACASSKNYVYKSPNRLDFVKVASAQKGEKEGGLRHPYTLDPEQIRGILRSVHFSKKVSFLKDIEGRELFRERHVELLAPYLLEAFQKVGADEVVVVSFFTQSRHLGLGNDRLTIFRTFVKEDGLHLKFSKIYAKLLGDRTTKGAERASQEARGIRVSLETEAGQERVSWDPEEIVFKLGYDFASASSLPEEKEVRARKKSHVAAREGEEGRSARERLKDLEKLKADELITEKEYQKKRREILKEM